MRIERGVNHEKNENDNSNACMGITACFNITAGGLRQ